MIHVHSMKIRFPCEESLWQRDNVVSWAMARPNVPSRPTLLEASRSLISKCEILPGTSNFVAWILLHALISISWALVSGNYADTMVHMLISRLLLAVARHGSSM
jgi:hypothetical protein